MKVFHVEFAKTGYGLSGGEKCMVEIIKYLKKKNIKNILLTTDNGKETYIELGLREDQFLEYIIIESSKTEKYGPFISYLLRPLYFSSIKKEIISKIDYKNDILMCHSDFFPNTIPTKILSKYFKKKPYYWFHMLAPDIFKGFEGHFLKKFSIPSLAGIHYKLNQILFKILTKKANIITVNPYYKKLFPTNKTYILNKFGGEQIYIIKKYAGVDIEKKGIKKDKKYDLSFIGRFHKQKGLFEIPKILKIIKKEKPNIKLVLIGGGNSKIEKRFFKIAEKEGVKDNIDYVGFISSDKKFDYIRKSKVFIFPSYYESFGQVALEAMANGLPVIAYDLPIYCVFEKGMIKVPILDNKTFAKEIMKLLNDKNYYNKISKDALNYASTFSWDKTGEEIYNLIKGK
ncbi:MAG: glycosyltransferase family 4 protein [Nanoarchaeota archaeon]